MGNVHAFDVPGLGVHLRGGAIEDPAAWQVSDDGREFMTRSSEAWGAAHEASGAPADVAAAAVRATTGFHVPEK
ncbi:hypothetical protein AB0F96_30355 [Streptomyces sp. NPDC023998]|uniref:hypothetical protein n=1 Tax=Streptomyces sp. NPDC023998 TaxID=3154597 RepID=UPI0033E2F1DF